MSFKKIRVLIVDESAFVRKAFKRMITSDEDLRVAGDASTCEEAIEKLLELRPHVVTLSTEMPGKGGLETLAEIMDKQPTPVIMASSISQSGKGKTFRALEMGAVDFIDKSVAETRMDLIKIKDDLIKKIKVASGVKLNKLERKRKLAREVEPIRKPARHKSPFADIRIKQATGKAPTHIVAIGSSTGGPTALEKTLVTIPADYPGAILIAQHMPEGFTKSMAARLNEICELRVKEGEEGDVIEAGAAYVARSGSHMKIRKVVDTYKIVITKSPRDAENHPQIDILFESVAKVYTGPMMAMVLTGMGTDGSRGVPLIKEAGGMVIAQDEATSVVYGMPKAAKATGVVDRVVPIERMGTQINAFRP